MTTKPNIESLSTRCRAVTYDGELLCPTRVLLLGPCRFYSIFADLDASCSCALKYVDTAGVFHRICEYCDSRKLNAMPDLSDILESIGYGVPLPGFDEINPSQPPHLTEYSPIRLPTIEEVEYTKLRKTPSKLDLSALKLQTPAAKRVTLDLDSPTRQTNPAKRRKVDHQDQEEPSPISSFQWTPVVSKFTSHISHKRLVS